MFRVTSQTRSHVASQMGSATGYPKWDPKAGSPVAVTVDLPVVTHAYGPTARIAAVSLLASASMHAATRDQS